MQHYLIGIDQGTTNSRAIIFNQEGVLLSQYEMPLAQSFKNPGWVEQDPLEMFNNTLTCCKESMKKLNLTASDIAAIGITNQRETTILWDKTNGEPIYPAIVWQDRRTADICEQFSKKPIAAQIQSKTGLLLDPYFSATKILWLLENIKDARKRAENGELLFGTVDTFLLWKFTAGKVHATDATNASRTLLFNIVTQQWDRDILKAFNIPENILPTVLDSSANFGATDEKFFGKNILIGGVAGDQQAATIGQTCFHEGMVKTTFGTGCFMLLNTGDRIIHSKQKLLSTVAYRLENKVTYGLEGSVFSAGVTIKWLRDTLKIIHTAEETEKHAASVNDTAGVYLVPAFTGLGAPYWAPHARAAILGLTSHANISHLVRAGLESVAYQAKDLLIAMQKDSDIMLETLRVDGGMVANKWFLQFLSDILNLPVERPRVIETTALGAAFLAGLQVGIYHSLKDIEKSFKLDLLVKPVISESLRSSYYNGWQNAVTKVLLPDKFV